MFGLQTQWAPEVLKLARGPDALGVMYMEPDSDDTWTDDHWSSEAEAQLEAPPPVPKQLPPMYVYLPLSCMLAFD